MKNICVLGDSHTVSIKNGWSSIREEYPNVTLTFFADRGAGIAELQPDGEMLVPASDRLRKILPVTSGGLETVDLKSYDGVLLVGLLSAYPQRHGHYSQAVVRQVLLDFAPECPALRLARKIRGVSPIPIFIAHRPLMESLTPPLDNPDLGPYRRTLQFLNDVIFKEVGATVLEQPGQTVARHFFTRPEYSKGAERLDVGDGVSGQPHKDHDRKHMNEEFGRLVLSTYLPIIAA